MEAFVIELVTEPPTPELKGLKTAKSVILAKSFNEALGQACDVLKGEVPDIEANRELIDHGIIRVENPFLSPWTLDYSICRATLLVPSQ